jgi:LuxR family transcriptional regulator, maltose regulon positive regulatory protein
VASPLVATKLYIPAVRRSLVARPRLSESLNRGATSRLTLISAPAGFGKTTLLSAWLAAPPAKERPVAWLSLEASDSQPGVFWTYVITALQAVAPAVGVGALPLLRSAQSPIETVLTTLLNELDAVPDDIHLVLDDYHLVDGPDVEIGMVFLLEHLPLHVHLVISSRADPALPLGRLRARGDLVEIRAVDLRFTLDEATDYLNEVAGLNLAADDITALEGRTEGWIAALQLAALSMQGRTDVAGFIAGFAGDDRYIVDYLVEEVLRRQPDDVRTFLIQTSILDRLSGPLCDAVTARPGGKAMLEALHRANLFVVPLDDNCRWYRYHHLFAEVLRVHLHDEDGDGAADLHRRASAWYDQNREPQLAVRHALSAGDIERAAGLVELAIPALLRSRQEPVIRGWLHALPDGLVRARPVLAVGLIGALMSLGEFDGVDARLHDVEQLLDQRPADRAQMIVVDEEGLLRLPGEIQMYRAGLALVRGDTAATIAHARLAVDRAAADDHLTLASASALSGLAHWSNGDLEAAHHAYSACVVGLRRVGHISDVLGCSIALADIRITQGRLGDALRTYERALQLAAEHGGSVALRGTADLLVGMSQIAFERNELGAAAELLRRSQELGEHTGLPQNRYRWRVSMARLRHAGGDEPGAFALLAEAAQAYTGDFFPNVQPVAAVTARLLAAAGRLGQALRWASEQNLSANDDVSYLHEFEHIALAGVLLAQNIAASTGEAVRLLDRLLIAAEAGTRTGSVIEILVLQALAHHTRGDTPGALAALGRALTLAEPEGYVRVFVGAGPPMLALLKAAAKRQASPDYVHRLVDAFSGDSTHRRGRPVQGLIDPLSERELVVLRLLASDLDGPAIARELIVSLNTLRTHTRNIYAKLGANSRREAVRRAKDLDLLSRAGDR